MLGDQLLVSMNVRGTEGARERGGTALRTMYVQRPAPLRAQPTGGPPTRTGELADVVATTVSARTGHASGKPS